MFSYMKVYCPICRNEFNGMIGYGSEANCCGKQCYDEWQWRRTLAILGNAYEPRKESTNGEKEKGKEANRVQGV